VCGRTLVHCRPNRDIGWAKQFGKGARCSTLFEDIHCEPKKTIKMLKDLHIPEQHCNMTLTAKKEIFVRIPNALASLMTLEKLWKSKLVSLQIKLSVLKTSFFSSML